MTLITKNKYPYISISRTPDHVYATPSGKLPSVTTILSATKSAEDKKALDGWRKAVGKAKADAICNEASSRGDRMHNYLEGYVLNGEIKKVGSNPYAKEAHIMATEIINKGLGNVTEYWGAEVDLYYPNIYAGATDLVGEHNGVPSIMDFKQTNKPKTDSRVVDYKVQLTAYAEAHNELYKTNINKGVIIMCVKPDNPSPGVYVNPQYQEWVVEGKEFDKYRKIWWQRVEEYYVNNPL